LAQTSKGNRSNAGTPTRNARGGPLGGIARWFFSTRSNASLWITLLDETTGKSSQFVDKAVGKPVDNPVDTFVDSFFAGIAVCGN
jgi:hypothetical protein